MTPAIAALVVCLLGPPPSPDPPRWQYSPPPPPALAPLVPSPGREQPGGTSAPARPVR